MKEQNHNKVYCAYCNGGGVIEDGSSFYTCPYCTEAAELMLKVEVAIAQLVLDDKEEQALELDMVYDLLQDCPVLAVLQARELGFPKGFVDEIVRIFDVKKID